MIIRLVIFSIIDGKLRIFLAGGELPSGTLHENERPDDGAKRIFQQFIGSPIQNFYYEQLYTFSFKIKSISTIILTYSFLYPEYKIPSKKILHWKPIRLKSHNKNDMGILSYAIQRLQWKVEYTNIVYSLLPLEFTFSHLQLAYEEILGKKLDKRNFRKKILSLKLLSVSGKTAKGMKARPAKMYQFSKKTPQMVKVFT